MHAADLLTYSKRMIVLALKFLIYCDSSVLGIKHYFITESNQRNKNFLMSNK